MDWCQNNHVVTRNVSPWDGDDPQTPSVIENVLDTALQGLICASSDDQMKRGWCRVHNSYFPLQTLPCTEALLGICSSLVFQFGRSLIDVADKNHDTGRFVNSWHKVSSSPSRSSIWWLYITLTGLWRHVSHVVALGFCGKVTDKF